MNEPSSSETSSNKTVRFGRATGITIVLTAVLLIGGLYFFTQSFTKARYNSRPDAIPVGAILPLSGKQQRIGQFIQRAFDMGIAEINDAGGVRQRKIKVNYEDDQAKPELAAPAMQKFADNRHISLVFGGWASSSVIQGQAPIAAKSKVPVLAMAQSPQITALGDYIFRIQPSSELYMGALVPYVIGNKGLTKFHVVHINNDYGKDLATLFTASCGKVGAKVLSTETYRDGDSDFHAIITKLKAGSDAQTGVFLAMYSEAGDFLRQAAELNYAVQFVGASPMENPDIIKKAGAAANGVIYAHHYDPETSYPKMLQFISEYRKRHGEDPEGYAALGYDAAFMIQQVLVDASADNTWPEREAVKKALYAVKNFQGVTGSYSLDENGDVQKPIYIRKIDNGRFTTIYRPPSQ